MIQLHRALCILVTFHIMSAFNFSNLTFGWTYRIQENWYRDVLVTTLLCRSIKLYLSHRKWCDFFTFLKEMIVCLEMKLDPIPKMIVLRWFRSHWRISEMYALDHMLNAEYWRQTQLPCFFLLKILLIILCDSHTEIAFQLSTNPKWYVSVFIHCIHIQWTFMDMKCIIRGKWIWFKDMHKTRMIRRKVQFVWCYATNNSSAKIVV